MMRIQRAIPCEHAPEVTVVVPCYNYGQYLRDVVDSALRQEGVQVRVIIVDDASPDGSGYVAQRMAAEDPRISVVVHECNQGHVATFNDGLSRVCTKYLTLVSADDVLAPGALSRAIGLMEEHPTVGLVYGKAVEFDTSAGVPRHMDFKNGTWTVWPGEQWLRLACWRGRCFMLSPEVVMRTAAWLQTGLYNEERPHTSDLDYWLRTAVNWDIGRVNGPAQAYYRVHSKNMHLTTFNSAELDLRHRLAAFDFLASETARQKLPHASRLHAQARRGIGREALLLAQRGLANDAATSVQSALASFGEDVAGPLERLVRGRLVRLRLKQAEAGMPPTALQRAVESYHRQFDRLRWTLWKWVGIS